jgi:hypothetical protein
MLPYLLIVATALTVATNDHRSLVIGITKRNDDNCIDHQVARLPCGSL